jgi:thiosulfate/3-mercaptopyruvate sulfurtransferase
MKQIMWRVFLVAFLVGAATNAKGEISVVSPDQAKAMIESSEVSKRPVVIDTRGGYKDYFRSHLPNAHHLNFDTLRGTDKGVPVQYLPDDLMRLLLRRAGIDRKKVHLLYATGASLPNDEILSTSMVAYVLEKYGVEEIRILDGGLAKWQQLGFPTTQEYFGNPEGELPETTPKNIGIDLNELLDKRGRPGVVLVDARPKNEYLGQDDIWVRKGHIPGAISFHWAKLMEDENTHQFRSIASSSELLRGAGITPDKEIIVYCGTSREGSLLRFFLAHVAGYPNVRLYEGSWKEYASLKQYPAELHESVVAP